MSNEDTNCGFYGPDGGLPGNSPGRFRAPGQMPSRNWGQILVDANKTTADLSCPSRQCPISMCLAC